MHLTPCAYAVRIFGGFGEVGRILGQSRSAVHDFIARRTKIGTAGDIPPHHARRLLEVARERGVDLTERDLIYGRDLPDAMPVATIG